LEREVLALKKMREDMSASWLSMMR
jgi:hypothetical protein